MKLLRRLFNRTNVDGNKAAVRQSAVADDVDSLELLGSQLAAASDHAAALARLEAALVLDPESADLYRHAADSASALRDLESARDYLVLALHYDEAHAETAGRLADVLENLGEGQAASRVQADFLSRYPQYVGQWFSLAARQYRTGDPESAMETLHTAIGLHPDDPALLNLMGLLAGREMGHLAEAERYLRRALDVEPGFSPALSNLGWLLAEQGRLEEALTYLDEVLQARPDDDETRLMRAYANLKHCRFAAGWRDFAARHASPLALKRPFDLPAFAPGGDLADRRMLVFGEQGLGDQIMFASCLPDLLAAGAEVALECEPKLESLFRRSFPSCEVFSAGRQTALPLLGGRKPECQLPIGDLSGLFRQTIQDFPNHGGYLRPDPGKVLVWRKRLEELGRGPYIGISWRGGTSATRRRLRSVPLKEWGPIIGQPCSFISLQYDECEEELAEARACGHDLQHWSEALADYDETAALVSALDQVITVCTAVVHLAGALGKPAWVLTPHAPEWRYQSEGETLPWYPSVRLFRQQEPPGWEAVISNVANELKKLA